MVDNEVLNFKDVVKIERRLVNSISIEDEDDVRGRNNFTKVEFNSGVKGYMA